MTRVYLFILTAAVAILLFTIFAVSSFCALALAAALADEIEGELQIFAIDRPMSADFEYYVTDAKGQRHKLKMPNSYRPGEKNLQSGQKVRVKGKRARALGGEFEVQALELAVAPLPYTYGVMNTLVMCVSYANQAAPCTATSALEFFRKTVDPFFREQSYGRLWLGGDKNPGDPGDFTDVTIALSSGGCDLWNITEQARAAAQAQGYRSAYARFVYLFPPSPCGWSGLAHVGGWGSSAWSNGEISCRVICHELGHNLGLYHCNSDLGTYGDYVCVMGNQGGDFTVFGREILGYVNVAGMPQIPTVVQSDDYAIDALDNQQNLGSSIKGIKILQSVNPTTGAKTFLYFSTRIGTWQGARRAVYVHTGRDDSGDTSLWKARVNADPVEYYDFYLDPGDVWTEPGFTVQTVSLGPTSAVLRVRFTSDPPPVVALPSAPTLLSVN